MSTGDGDGPLATTATQLRRRGLLLFAGGVALALVLGALLAAVDLWGGVRTLGVSPRLLGAAFALAAALLIGGTGSWIASWPPASRVRRAMQAAVVLAVAVAMIGGGLFAYYAERLGTSGRICTRAACAATRGQRDALVDEGLGPLFPVIDPAYECIDLERQRRGLDRTGACPTILLDDTPCTCGSQAWGPGHPDRCATGRSTCESRGGRDLRIGCASEFHRSLLARCPPAP